MFATTAISTLSSSNETSLDGLSRGSVLIDSLHWARHSVSLDNGHGNRLHRRVLNGDRLTDDRLDVGLDNSLLDGVGDGLLNRLDFGDGVLLDLGRAHNRLSDQRGSDLLLLHRTTEAASLLHGTSAESRATLLHGSRSAEARSALAARAISTAIASAIASTVASSAIVSSISAKAERSNISTNGSRSLEAKSAVSEATLAYPGDSAVSS